MWWLLFLPPEEAAQIAKWSLIVAAIFLIIIGVGYCATKPHCKAPQHTSGTTTTYDTINKTDSTITLKIKKK